MHFHISLNDRQGDNSLCLPPPGELNEMTRLCRPGYHLMPASLAIMAPGSTLFAACEKLDEPVFSSWGYNTRSAALRIPCSTEENRRIEYRLAGADANPYLVMATILTGMLYGLENIDGDSEEDILRTAPLLPLFQHRCNRRFSGMPVSARQPSGQAFSRQWIHSKLEELTLFEGIVTQEETAISF